MFGHSFELKLPKTGILGTGSLAIALLLPVIVLVSLPGYMIDVFVVANFIGALMMLVIMLENSEPLKLTFLPTAVLLLTTFRLILSIATTRNIIADENVGEVITTIGQMIMSGSLISGLLIFVIITIVQFLVVTKGGERVAEVGARFSLDALPGRQMTIDSDLKSGTISVEQAQKMRADLSTENKLFGSLDGAMKFIKGDAIASILISLVNLFGGIYVGVNVLGLSLGDSVNRFSVLTVGDGLVSQIPSLLLSMACGVYLTRIQGSDEESQNFMDQVINQISLFWKSLLIIGVMILLVAFFNNDLITVFLPTAIVCIAMAYFLRRKNIPVDTTKHNEAVGQGLLETITFEFNNKGHQAIVYDNIVKVEKPLWNARIGTPTITVNNELDCDLKVKIADIDVFEYRHADSDPLIEIMNDAVFLRHEDSTQNITAIVRYFIWKQMLEKYNLQYTSDIIDSLSVKSFALKTQIDNSVPLNQLHDVLKDMIAAPEFYLDQVSFFEALLDATKVESDRKQWFNRIRPHAKYETFSNILSATDGHIFIIFLSVEFTDQIKNFYSGGQDSVDEIIEIKDFLRTHIIQLLQKNGSMPIIVVDDSDVIYVKSFIQGVISTMVVAGHSEMVSSIDLSHSEQLSSPVA